ncbi:MAG: flagellar protein FlaG [Nitrospira sp.]
MAAHSQPAHYLLRAAVAPSDSASSAARKEGNELARSVAKIEQVLQSAGLQVRLLVDQETERVVVRVVKESGEVVRQFPPEEILELTKYLSEEQQSQLERGVFLEQRI